jgi:hypothetical protein
MKRYLPMLVMAFEAPETTLPDDREPRVTSVLLQFLKGHITDAHMQAQVLSTAAMIQKEGASH